MHEALAIAFFFVVAYFNSRKEDDSEEKRIKDEVKRLVRLKKEFEESEEQEAREAFIELKSCQDLHIIATLFI